MPPVHIVDRYMQTVESLGIKNDSKGLDYFIPPIDEVTVSSLPNSHHNGYIGFVIGAKHFTKQLPVEKIVSICKKINQPVILLGGPDDAERGELIKKAFIDFKIAPNSQLPASNSQPLTQNSELIYNACGKYNLNQSASIIKQATKIISHDTGLMHIAVAFKKEIISVWGNTVPDFGFTPYLPAEGSKIVEVKDLSCRPCSKIGYDKCPKGHFKCMMLIDETQFV